MLLSWITLDVLIGTVLFLLAVIGAGHALTHKRDPRAALLWISVCLSVPFFGTLIYVLFGINRSNWKAIKLAADPLSHPSHPVLPQCLPLVEDHYLQPVMLARTLTGQQLVDGNRITQLENGEKAYPAMLASIHEAQQWVYLATYIFEHKHIGAEFIDALVAAQARGVDVFVLLDGIGAWYSGAKTARMLRKRGVHVTRFLPISAVIPKLTINLRNHRKLLIVDGFSAFTGGMNIRDVHLVAKHKTQDATQDVQFQIEGPVVSQLINLFQDDWFYASGETLEHVRSERTILDGKIACRAISDGPGVVIDVLTKILVSAIHHAQESIDIVTPYFLPPQEVIMALQSAALRGVKVRVILPEKNNLPYVQWAMNNALWQFLQHNIKIYYQPAPFDHSKLLVIDRYYCQFGSANLDTRSLRLNFELNLECYDHNLGRQLAGLIAEKQLKSRELHLSDLQSRSFIKRMWDGFWWLFTPYL